MTEVNIDNMGRGTNKHATGLKSQTTESKVYSSRKTKIDGGCYEVYGTMPNGDRVEAYYHPVTFKQLLVSRRGQVVYRADGK